MDKNWRTEYERILSAATEIVLATSVRTIQKNAKLAVQYAKQAINTGMQTDIDSGMSIEEHIFGLCFATEDQKEGMQAFLEKRKANFKSC